MKNPWTDLPKKKEYVLPCDYEAIKKYNEKAKEEKKIITDQLPGPYVGNPLKSSVVILSLNPGYNEKEDYILHSRVDFSTDLKKNLLHEEIEYPFYYLNPHYKEGGGYRYWHPFLEDIIKEIGGSNPEKLIAAKIAVIEWFPYRSSTFGWLKCLCGVKSREYSHELARQAIDNKKVVVMHRALKEWESSIGSLEYCIKSVKPFRNWHLKKKNLKDGDFDKICNAINR